MKVLFCSNEFYPLTGGAVGTYHLVRGFKQRGHDVVAAGPMRQSREVGRILGVSVAPFNMPFRVGKDVPLRGPRYIGYGLAFTGFLLHLLRRVGPDLLFVRNSIAGLSASILSRALKSPCALSLTDLLTGFLYEDPFYPKLLVSGMVSLEKRIPRAFGRVFVVTPRMKQEIVRAGTPEDKVVVSYDGVDTRLFGIENANPDMVKKRFGLGTTPILFFHGTIDYHHGVGNMIQIMENVLSAVDNLKVMIVGGGLEFPRLRAVFRANPRVIVTGYVPYDQVPSYIACSDVGMIPYQKNYSSDMVITLKLLEYLAMGKPVVSTNLASLCEIFGDYPFVRLAGGVREFAEEVEFLFSLDKEERLNLGLAARQIVEKNFAWDVVSRRVISECERMAGA